jgi:PAB1-binding protein PBP1
VEVYINGTKKFLNTDYTVDLGTQTVSFVNVPTAGDVIAVTTLVDKHYRMEGTDIIFDTAQIASDSISFSASDVITVTTFNNALGMKQRREVLEGRTIGRILSGTGATEHGLCVCGPQLHRDSVSGY